MKHKSSGSLSNYANSYSSCFPSFSPKLHVERVSWILNESVNKVLETGLGYRGRGERDVPAARWPPPTAPSSVPCLRHHRSPVLLLWPFLRHTAVLHPAPHGDVLLNVPSVQNLCYLGKHSVCEFLIKSVDKVTLTEGTGSASPRVPY